MDLRCQQKKYAELNVLEGIIEIKCASRFCTGGNAVVVIHRWNAATGEVLKDLRFKNPNRHRKAKEHGSHSNSAAIRNP